jgi:hypothetical protein
VSVTRGLIAVSIRLLYAIRIPANEQIRFKPAREFVSLDFPPLSVLLEQSLVYTHAVLPIVKPWRGRPGGTASERTGGTLEECV